MILQDNNLELCNALPVFMATSKDLKFSDCHNELVITCREEKEDKISAVLEKALSVIRIRFVTSSPRSFTQGVCGLL